MANKNRSIYYAWSHMRSRCYKVGDISYPRYGGRGIGVCDRWLDSYDNFRQDMASGYKHGLSLDRIDNDGDYTPQNCRWATPKQQANNRRSSRYATLDGITKTLSEWADLSPVNRSTFKQRYYVYGWDIEDCFKSVGGKQVG